MRINKNKNNCCGCNACYSICPANAITMQADTFGFMYPSINNEKCIDCGLCEKVCQFKSDYSTFDTNKPQIFALRNKDTNQLLKSQSGGAFWTIAHSFINNKGVVYGVGYGENFKIIHKRVDNVNDLEELRGSKYVQSEIGETFKDVLHDLKKGEKVLFSGTSCQIANLKSYIGNKWRHNLFTIDIICHGVPSPYVWSDFITYIEKKKNNNIISVNFRDKTKGWENCVSSFKFKDNIYYTKEYSKIFYSKLFLRECCYICPFTNFNRVSDITIGDFWGWEKQSNLFNDNKGVSLLLVNSPKGHLLVNSVKDKVYLIEKDKDSCLQKNLKEPTYRNPLRTKIETDYYSKGFDFVYNKYINLNPFEKILRKIKSIIKFK